MADPEDLDFAPAFREWRQSAGMRQREAARQLGITAVHLCNLESGKSQPSLKLIARIEQAYGVNLYLLAWLSRFYLPNDELLTQQFENAYRDYYQISGGSSDD
jgi:transcriptional regulator with XRE-family HTH domain